MNAYNTDCDVRYSDADAIYPDVVAWYSDEIILIYSGLSI